jgi:hypothetical protein
MKAYVLDPLSIMGLMAGYTRPLDKHDFPHGSYPDYVGRFVPGVGELKRHANLTGLAGSTGMAIDTFSWSSDQKHPLGTMAVTKDGRVFRYVKAGAAALVVGDCIQSPAIVPNHLALTAAATAIGATRTVFTLGATAADANQYAEGYLGVDTTPDLGRTYTISGHAAVLSSGSMTLNLMPDDPVQVAFTTSTRLGLVANKGAGAIQMPVTTATGTLIGVANSAIAIANYGWIQSKGIKSTLIAGTPALGAIVMTPGAVAGAAEIIVAAGTLIVAQIVGKMCQVGVAGKCNFVDLMID